MLIFVFIYRKKRYLIIPRFLCLLSVKSEERHVRLSLCQYLLETSWFQSLLHKEIVFIYKNGSVFIEDFKAGAINISWSTKSSQSSSSWRMNWSSLRLSVQTNTLRQNDAEINATKSMSTKVATPAYTSTVASVRMEWTVNLPISSEGSSQSQHRLVKFAGRCSISTIVLLNRIAGTRTTWGMSLVCGIRLANASLQLWNAVTPTKRRPKWKRNASSILC